MAKNPSRIPYRVNHCADCDKVSYLTRNDAKKDAKRLRERGLTDYACPVSQFYHLGHLPRNVRNGTIGRAELGRP